jgi:hypothetical protein
VCVVPAAADLTPSPSVVFPTKILEYMACRRAVVAPRRETLAHVVENNREALLFEPGDPLDLARKVLRLIGEPLLRERIAQNAYERVRREFTASAARRALRTAYNALVERFAVPLFDTASDEAPKVELLADDDFEATVFEEAPAPPPVDTALNKLQALEDALSSLAESEGAGSTSNESAIGPPAPRRPGATSSEASDEAPDEAPDETRDETIERDPVRPARDGGWIASALAAPPIGHDDWVVTNVAHAVRVIEAEDVDVVSEMLIEEGTPIEGVIVGLSMSTVEASFVAGEIDVPTPPSLERDQDTPSVEFTAASAILGQPEPLDPDTGSRTPPIERR